jgi:deoxyribodipyrimidine photolyase-like uncharacterized protein
MEIRQETDYVKHHIQKVAAFFAAMRAFADHLKVKGHRVIYIALDDPENRQTIRDNILHRQHPASHSVQKLHALRLPFAGRAPAGSTATRHGQIPAGAVYRSGHRAFPHGKM